MKRLVSIFFVSLLTVGLLCGLPVSAAEGKLTVSAASSVTVGESITVTLKYDGDSKPIGGIIGNLTYDTAIFSYTSFTGTDVQVNGGAGKMRFIFSPAAAEAPSAVTVTFTFKALTPGSCDFAVTTEEFISDEDYSSLGAPSGGVTVTASNPTLSGNANLSKLTPSKGTLTPKFDPDVTEYKISVANSVTSLSLSATTAHSSAKTSISGKNALSVGKNTRVITVTAPNGTTKKYTVVITRAAAPSTTTGTNPPTGTTQPPPPEDALEVTINGKTMTILDTQASVDLPKGFSWSNLTINRVEVPAAVNKDTNMTLLYLVSEDKTEDGFFIYDVEEDTFTRFRTLTVGGGTYLLYDPPADKGLKNLMRSVLDYEGGQVSAYIHRDGALKDFCVVWAAPMGGEAGWYTYDKKEGTLQRYHTTAVEGDAVTSPSATPEQDTVGNVSEEPKDSFFEKNKQIFAIGGIAVAGLVVLVLLFLMIVSAVGNKKGKH
ncbi:MAG: cadherin-like beta sandwich domain-containing protein [Clostridia bacterium]|nr:cadherin-like beta sandwich domain-containing protein [Clostridia bacterium]